MSDPKLTDCPECDESTLVKKISAVAFRLKGSGWYETDFKSGNKRQLHEDGNKSESKSGSDDGASKSDTKTEAKSSEKKSSEPSKSTSSAQSAPSA